MKVLVTGSAGFIGSALCLRLLARGDYVIGLDNHNDYYDPRIKEDRLARHVDHQNYTHLRIDLVDRSAMERAFVDHKPDSTMIADIEETAKKQREFKSKHQYDLSKFGLSEEQIKRDAKIIYDTFFNE